MLFYFSMMSIMHSPAFNSPIQCLISLNPCIISLCSMPSAACPSHLLFCCIFIEAICLQPVEDTKGQCPNFLLFVTVYHFLHVL